MKTEYHLYEIQPKLQCFIRYHTRFLHIYKLVALHLLHLLMFTCIFSSKNIKHQNQLDKIHFAVHCCSCFSHDCCDIPLSPSTQLPSYDPLQTANRKEYDKVCQNSQLTIESFKMCRLLFVFFLQVICLFQNTAIFWYQKVCVSLMNLQFLI